MQSTISFHNDQAVGPRFMHISNADLALMAKGLGLAVDSAANVRIVGNDRRMTALIKLPSLAWDGGDSTLVPQLFLSNDNTGRRSLRISVGLFRLVCSNGLTVGVPGLSFETRIRHVWGELNRGKVLDLPLVAESLLLHIANELPLQVEMAKDTHVRDAIGIVASLPIGERAREDAISRLAFGDTRAEDDTGTAWGLYNVVNESVRMRSRSERTALAKDEGLLSHIMGLAAA